MAELREYFGTREWDLEIKSSDEIHSRHTSNRLTVDIKRSHAMFTVNMYAVDDPGDADEVTTDNPAEEISKYLSKGLPGGHKEGCTPKQMMTMLQQIAIVIKQGSIRKKHNVIRLLKRIAIAPTLGLMTHMAHFLYMALTDTDKWEAEIEELHAIQGELKKNQWTVVDSKSDTGEPKLEVNVQDIFEADISVDGMWYDFSFEVDDMPDSKEEGQSADPIREFTDWYQSKKYKDAIKNRGGNPPPSSDDGATVHGPTMKAPGKTQAP